MSHVECENVLSCGLFTIVFSSPMSYVEAAYSTIMQVAGEASEVQLLAALKRYSSRAIYAQKGLYNLFSLTRDLTEEFKKPRLDVIQVTLA